MSETLGVMLGQDASGFFIVCGVGVEAQVAGRVSAVEAACLGSGALGIHLGCWDFQRSSQ